MQPAKSIDRSNIFNPPPFIYKKVWELRPHRVTHSRRRQRVVGPGDSCLALTMGGRMMKEQKTKKGRKKKVRDKSLHEGFCDKVKKEKEREEG